MLRFRWHYRWVWLRGGARENRVWTIWNLLSTCWSSRERSRLRYGNRSLCVCVCVYVHMHTYMSHNQVLNTQNMVTNRLNGCGLLPR